VTLLCFFTANEKLLNRQVEIRLKPEPDLEVRDRESVLLAETLQTLFAREGKLRILYAQIDSLTRAAKDS
jgi:hypothetical protein